jgi:molecular chaperone GrpE
MDKDNVIDPAPDAPESSDAPQVGSELQALQQERDDLYDRLLRKTAEFDNYRKRVERDRRAQVDEALVGILLDLLLVVDDFDRAIAAGGSEAPGTSDAGDAGNAGAASYRKGVELIHAKVEDVLRKRGVTPIVTLGQDFDPNLHQAVAHEASPGHRDGEVIEEMRRGYLLGDRLLRPAMVKVAKA